MAGVNYQSGLSPAETQGLSLLQGAGHEVSAPPASARHPVRGQGSTLLHSWMCLGAGIIDGESQN